MKQPTYPMPLFFGFCVLLMAAVAWMTSALLQEVSLRGNLHWLILLIPAVLCSVGALIAHLRSKERTWAYLLSYSLNALGSGWAVGVLMGVKGMLPTATLVMSLLPALFLGILCWIVLAAIDRWPTIVTSIFVVLSVALLITGIVFWVRFAPLVGCTMVFSALFLLPYPVAVNLAMDTPSETYRYLSFSGFGGFVLIFTVVLFVLTEGEVLEGLDGGFDLNSGSGSRTRRKRNR